MNLEDLGKDTYPELLLGAAQDLIKEQARAEAARTSRRERRAQRLGLIAHLLGRRP